VGGKLCVRSAANGIRISSAKFQYMTFSRIQHICRAQSGSFHFRHRVAGHLASKQTRG